MIKIIIERKIIEGFEDYYDQLVRKTIAVALQAPGYMTSEVLVNRERNNHRIVTTQWSSLYHWEQWCASTSRQQIIDKIRPVLEEQERVIVTQYQCYQYH